MKDKRFSIKEGSSVGLSSIYTDNGKVMTQLEVLDVLINQHKTIKDLQDEVFDWKESAEDYLRLGKSLKKENEELKAQLKDCEKRVTDKEVEWLRNNTVWEQMPSNKRTFITTSAKEDYK